ncbi:hypothetical protein BU25DRAFT_458185 [Macroventuria anomochaeta]|uniref:Uncharacterized protein n=1 Tax=Macroventuria anomochaeta TaxID=301207 RepID=A0ACB6S305_9PLEO|nr:uncharacterized protein BU25DRAFT_458185 [Macroventuria anomochaeta]KAF2627773.1 hypothetical protein BU25DRAFT_458185 [Macroventuria anomochaeta]
MATAHPNIHAVADLIARAIDPATIDPTKLSVLSVLKTAMPTGTGTDIVLPTGDVAPQWYKDLPADVMVLLAQMYPATPTVAVAMSQTTNASLNGTEIAVQKTASVSESQTTLTRTLELVPTSTAAANKTLSTGSPSDNSTNVTLSTGAPSPTQSVFSIGAKNTVGTGKWSVVMGLGVAAVFCFFA